MRNLRGRPCLLVAVGVILAVAAGCGGTGRTPSASGRVVARIGALEVIDPFLPDPASPSVASVYLTLRNTGSTPDALVGVSSPAAPTSMLMSEGEQGTDGTMSALTRLVIPAHGEATLRPGHDHAMLEQPTTRFSVGQKVSVTLRFARAGTVTVAVPVVPLDAILGGGSMSGMPGMPGN